MISTQIISLNARLWREYLGIKQQTVADELNVSRKWYGELENGKASFNVEQILAIARLFDVDPNEFFQKAVNLPPKIPIPVGLSPQVELLIEQKIAEAFRKLAGG
jgi:transcriptional regulator with XRE-family HTH domain